MWVWYQRSSQCREPIHSLESQETFSSLDTFVRPQAGWAHLRAPLSVLTQFLLTVMGSRHWRSGVQVRSLVPPLGPEVSAPFASAEHSHLTSFLSARNKQAKPITETKMTRIRKNTRLFQVWKQVWFRTILVCYLLIFCQRHICLFE